MEDRAAASRYADKLELVYREYEECLDLEIALSVVPISESDRERLRQDEDLKARIALCDYNEQRELIKSLRDLIRSASSESVQLAAIKELGRTIYPKRFKEDSGKQNAADAANAYLKVLEEAHALRKANS